MGNGFVKFNRKIKNWGWYTDVNTFKLFFHLILCANYAEGYFLGVKILRGQIATSFDSLAEESGLTRQEVRTALKHLETTGEITRKSHAKFSVISIPNYDLYQAEQHATNTQSTHNQHTINTQSTSIEERKKKKNKRNKYISSSSSCACAREKIFFDKWGRSPSKLELNVVAELSETVSDDERLLEKALELSAEAGAMKISYVRGIYENFRRNGIKSFEEYERHELSRRSRKGSKKQSTQEEQASVDTVAAERLRNLNRRHREEEGD